jgi:hypothetical protein
MLRTCLILIVAIGVAGPAMADWEPGDGHKMHFPQLPDMEGWDVNGTFPKILADDWMCSETGWVKDIHFWGSWREDLVGEITNLHLSIHSNIPDGGQGYSVPGDELWSVDLLPGAWVEKFWGEGPQGWYDPNTGYWNKPDHYGVWQYNVFLPDSQWFWQEKDEIYWLDISVTLADPNFTHWGWKTSLDHFMDDATWKDYGGDFWYELRDPITQESLDMAFVITPGPGTLALLALAGMTPRRRRR